MTTLASDNMRWYAQQWDTALDYPSAVFSGIVGDAAHLAGGGYHISIEDNRAGNYSVTRPHDAAPPGNWSRKHASAVDMSMSKADQVKCWDRLYAVWLDHSDPRRKYFNAINGWNGVGEPERLDFIANTRKITDRSHWYHTHDETPREWYNDVDCFVAKLSVLRGETKEQYLNQGGNMGAAENADQAHWLGGTSMGPAVPEGYRVLELGEVSKVEGKSYFGNAQNDRLYFIQKMLEKITQEGAPVQLNSMQFESLSNRLAQAVVEAPDNGLTAADLDAVKAVVKDVLGTTKLDAG